MVKLQPRDSKRLLRLQESVEYGYGMKAERWSGSLPDGEASEDWGLPGGTEVRVVMSFLALSVGAILLLSIAVKHVSAFVVPGRMAIRATGASMFPPGRA